MASSTLIDIHDVGYLNLLILLINKWLLTETYEMRDQMRAVVFRHPSDHTMRHRLARSDEFTFQNST